MLYPCGPYKSSKAIQSTAIGVLKKEYVAVIDVFSL